MIRKLLNTKYTITIFVLIVISVGVVFLPIPANHQQNISSNTYNQGEHRGTTVTTSENLSLDYQIIFSEDFSDPDSINQSRWNVSTRTDGSLKIQPESIHLRTTDSGDYVGITSHRQFDFGNTPALELDFIARAPGSEGVNTQEFFFLNGSDSEENFFVMYDMGGASKNPDNLDDSCGASRDTPYNRDQLSYRNFLTNEQCWDGFEGRPINWSQPWHGELRVNFNENRITAFRNSTHIASLRQSDGQTMPPQTHYRIWFKNNDKGGSGDLIVYRVQVQRIGRYQQSGTYVSGPINAGSNVTWTSAEVVAETPPGTSFDVDFATNQSGEWIYYDQIEQLPDSKFIRYRVTLDTSYETKTPTISEITLYHDPE
ncbi:hypothetical protein [Halobacterium salinarum]|uniref:hypothetical protein n=1 Tax=Halobacterium salinarum TaxID=2242 RepID=UPI001F1E6A8C|nr:hypothetical protein [Halobacterium salinarum]MCF2165493.1 hypothetical protein [Halobacterium salinarum]MCF2166687.1 hypothetical protein [Halobacterium salinarum]